MHADGTATTGIRNTWCTIADTISWASLLSKGRKLLSSVGLFIICVLHGVLQAVVDDQKPTEDALWAEITWSLKLLFLGLHPDRCNAGIPYTIGRNYEKNNTTGRRVFRNPLGSNLRSGLEHKEVPR